MWIKSLEEDTAFLLSCRSARRDHARRDQRARISALLLSRCYACVTPVLRLRYACVTPALRLRYACVTPVFVSIYYAFAGIKLRLNAGVYDTSRPIDWRVKDAKDIS